MNHETVSFQDISSRKKFQVSSEFTKAMCLSCNLRFGKVADFVHTVWSDRCNKVDRLLENLNRTNIKILNCKKHVEFTVSLRKSENIPIPQKVFEHLNEIDRLSEEWNIRKSEISNMLKQFKTASSKFCELYMNAAVSGRVTQLYEASKGCKSVHSTEMNNKRKLNSIFRTCDDSPEQMIVPEAVYIEDAFDENEISNLNPRKILRLNNGTDSVCYSSDTSTNAVPIANSIFKNTFQSTNNNTNFVSRSSFCNNQRTLHFPSTSVQERGEAASFMSYNERSMPDYSLERIQNQSDIIYHQNSSNGSANLSSGTNEVISSLLVSQSPPVTQSTSNFQASLPSTSREHKTEIAEIPFLQTERPQVIQCAVGKSNCTNDEAINYIMKDFYKRIYCICENMVPDIETNFNVKLSYTEACKEHLNECIKLMWSQETFESLSEKFSLKENS